MEEECDMKHRITSIAISYNNAIYCMSVGNFMYFAATSKYMILGSRFVVGE